MRSDRDFVGSESASPFFTGPASHNPDGVGDEDETSRAVLNGWQVISNGSEDEGSLSGCYDPLLSWMQH